MEYRLQAEDFCKTRLRLKAVLHARTGFAVPV